MEQEFKNIDKISRYVNGQMDDKELEAFEAELAANEELAKEVAFHQELMIGVEVYEDRALEDTIKGVHNKLNEEDFFNPQQTKIVKMETSKSSSRRYFLSIAASLALVVAAAIYLMRPQPSGDPVKEAFAQFYHPDTTQIKGVLDRLEAMGMAADTDGKTDTLAEALRFYEEYEFDSARKALQDYLQRYPNDKMAQLYFGLSFIQLGNYGRGVELLQPLANDKSFDKQNMAMWYTALGFVQFEGDSGKNNAKKLLEILCKMNTDYQTLACNYLEHFL